MNLPAERNCSAAVADALVAAGTRHLFAYPGDPIIEVMERARAADIDVVLARREGTAAFMAEAMAMATGQLGVCLSTLGPGSTALLNGVAAATLDRVPMLAISGQIERSREQFFTHQVVDHGRLYAPVTKWAGRLEPEASSAVLRRAMRVALAERPGAVHLTINGDVAKAPSDGRPFTMPPVDSDVHTMSVFARDGADPVAMLSAARRPVLLAGIGAVRARAGSELVRLAEAAGVPIVVAPMAKGIVVEDHPLFAGVLDMACNDLLWSFLSDCDLIVTAGFDAVELIKPWSVTAPVLHVDSIPNIDQIYESPCECVGDIAAILGWFADSWRGEPRWSQAEVAEHRRTLAAAFRAGRVAGKLNPSEVIDIARASAPRDTLATTDVGSHKLLVGQGWTAYEPRTVLMTNGLSAMGFGVPAAIAAKLAYPDRPVLALVGDGGFAMTATELRLAAALGLGIVFLVMVDGSLNRIELKQMTQGYASTATRIEDTDLVQLAQSMNCDGTDVRSIAELEAALAGMGSLTRPLVVAAHIDPSQYLSQF